MLYTKNDLSKNTRNSVIGLCQQRLADILDLSMQAKQAHWNVRGANFISLHELFDRIHEEIEEASDSLAERIAQLGGIAHGTCQAIAKNSSMPEYPLTLSEEYEHIDTLSNSLAAFGKTVRKDIQYANDWNDLVTADILVKVAKKADKWLWLVENHLIGPRAEMGKMVEGAA